MEDHRTKQYNLSGHWTLKNFKCSLNDVYHKLGLVRSQHNFLPIDYLTENHE